MSKILLDMQVAETYSLGLGDSVNNKFEKNYDSLNAFYTSILKKYNVSFEDFNDAVVWYQKRPARMDSLLSGALNQLSEVKAKEKIKDFDPNAENKPPPVKDSVGKKDTLDKNKPLKKPDIKDTTLKNKPRPAHQQNTQKTTS